jgi:triosephosphate isomerase (TIM)
MRARLVAGNWKMHGNRASNRALLDAVIRGMSEISGVECAVCVPFPYLAEATVQLGRTRVGCAAQNVSEYPQGAYTGEVSAAMLAEFDCRYVLVGHSERRHIFRETDAQVAAKFVAAQAAGIAPILCVGETLEERDAGRTEETVARQLDAVLEKAGAAALAKSVVAYEPVWAIGTGRNATPEQAQAVHAYLRGRIAERNKEVAAQLRVLYGGSVKPANAKALFSMGDIDGGLIGGASLVADDFLAIVRAAEPRG